MTTAAHVTAETITCRKCAAVGIRNFVCRPVYLADAPALDVISCLICGNWYSSRPMASAMERPVDKEPEQKYNFSSWTACAKPGCPSHLRPARVAAGETLCSRCAKGEIRQQVNAIVNPAPPAADNAALTQQEVTHVETIQKLPRLAPPAPTASAVRHPPRRSPLLRRDDSESVARPVPLAADWENAPQPAELAQLLTAIGLAVSIDVIICHWQPAERVEVKAWVTTVQRVKSRRHVPPMPDVLCPIYDASYNTAELTTL